MQAPIGSVGASELVCFGKECVPIVLVMSIAVHCSSYSPMSWVLLLGGTPLFLGAFSCVGAVTSASVFVEAFHASVLYSVISH